MLARQLARVLVAASVLVVGLPAGAQVALASVPTCGTNGVPSFASGVSKCVYTSTAPDTFNVPGTVTSILVIATGGKGGDGFYKNTHPGHASGGGAFGALVSGTSSVTPGASLTIRVAGNGSPGTQPTGGNGGANGGGAGGSGSGTVGDPGGGGGGGGGVTSVYATSTALAVAAGGGGGGGTYANVAGGNGGAAGQDGQDAAFYDCNGGGAGTSSAGGAGGNGGATPTSGTNSGPCNAGGNPGAGTTGSEGQGGAGGGSTIAGGGGGGGGRYGGGGGQGSDRGDSSGGGGGSSYSTDNSASITTDSTGTPSIEIRYTLPSPNVVAYVKDGATDNDWDNTELPGASAYGTSSVTPTGVSPPTPTGSVTYKWWSNGTCMDNPDSSEEKALNSGNVPNSTASSREAGGNYSMRADYDGDTNYVASKSSCQPFNINKLNQTISFTSTKPALAVVGMTYDPTATSSSSLAVDLTVAGPCSYSAPTVTFLGVGFCRVKANQPGDGTYNAALQVVQQINVRPRSGGTITNNIVAVSAGATGQTIVFTYTAPAGGMVNGTVRITVPAGWSIPSTSPSARGYSTASTGTRSISSRTIEVNGVTLSAGGQLTIVYGGKTGGGPGATAPTAVGSQTWTTQQRSTTTGTAAALQTSPTIAIKAADGSGTMTASITQVAAHATGRTITFTYTVAAGGITNGRLTLKVPVGWSAPSTAPTAAGRVTASAGLVSISGRTIMVTGLVKPAGANIVITYGSKVGGGPGATAPSTTGLQTWFAGERSSLTGTVKPLASSPKIKVV